MENECSRDETHTLGILYLAEMRFFFQKEPKICRVSVPYPNLTNVKLFNMVSYTEI